MGGLQVKGLQVTRHLPRQRALVPALVGSKVMAPSKGQRALSE